MPKRNLKSPVETQKKSRPDNSTDSGSETEPELDDAMVYENPLKQRDAFTNIELIVREIKTKIDETIGENQKGKCPDAVKDFIKGKCDLILTITGEEKISQECKLIRSMQRIVKLTESVKETVESSNNSLTTTLTETVRATVPKIPMSYAQVTRPKKIPEKEKPRFTIAIKSTDGKSSESVRKTLERSVKLREIKVDATVRHNKDKVFFDTHSTEQLAKLEEEILKKSEGKVTVERLKKRRPLMIIHNVPSSISKDELIEEILERNGPVKETAQELEQNQMETDDSNGPLKLRFVMKARTNGSYNAVIEIHGKVRMVIKRLERLYVGFSRVRLDDFDPVTICFKCQGYGHISKNCSAQKDTCPHCSEEHKLIECPHKNDESKKRCTNCAKSSVKGKESVSLTHRANSKQCPVFNKQCEIMRLRTDYGHGS